MLDEQRNCNLGLRRWWGWIEPPPPLQIIVTLKRELQTKLNRTAAAGANYRVRGGHIRGRARTTERPTRGVIMGPSILSAERVGEVRMIEDVEEFYAELSSELLAPLEVLGHGEIHVLESCIPED